MLPRTHTFKLFCAVVCLTPIISVTYLHLHATPERGTSPSCPRTNRDISTPLDHTGTFDTSDNTVAGHMRERRRWVEDTCKRRQFMCHFNSTLKFHLFPFHEFNATVCTIAKAGSSTWRSHLRRVNLGPPSHLPIAVDARRHALLSRPQHDALEAIRATVNILTVRHPLTRLVSCFRNKYKAGNPLPPHRPEWERRRRKCPKDPIDGVDAASPSQKMAGASWADKFHQFWLPALFSNDLVPKDLHVAIGLSTPINPDVRYDSWVYEQIHSRLRPRVGFVQFLRHVVATHRGGRPDGHWSQYHKDCCPCLLRYSFVTRVETLTEDLAHVFGVLGIPSDPSVSLNRIRKSYDDPYKELRYYRKVPLAIRKELYEYIKTDLEMFNYHLPPGFLEK
ncbi:carbohydrate sulfotransferase 9-like [Penaeus vannamei]|uniref:carbohydrate sulfotransferase 9-like n=1 Tax=Penaeus vannamei TaxID=6689 RepID=UPI00387F4FA0